MTIGLQVFLENFPGKPFIVTESVSGLMTRGYYRMPSDSMFIWPNVGISLSMMPRSLAPPTTTVMFLGATVTKVLCVM